MKNKVILITGSATGLGNRIAKDLAEIGAHIVINYRKSKEEAEALTTKLSDFGVRSLAIQGDITDANDCKRLIEETIKAFGRIDILINNGGPYIHERKSVMEYTVEEWNYIINGNLNSVFYLCKEILPLMRKQGWGRIITFGFERVESAPGWVCRSAFAAAKSGLASLTRTLAQEEAPYGITVNMISPGDIRGNFKEATIDYAKEHQDTFQRSGTGQDISRIIAFLCNEQSDFITGSIIPVTGGTEVISRSFMEYEKLLQNTDQD